MLRIASIIISSLLTISGYLYAQGLYIPDNNLKAYNSKTRSYDGRPVPDYYQNKASYKIKAEFDPVPKILKGSEWILLLKRQTKKSFRFTLMMIFCQIKIPIITTLN